MNKNIHIIGSGFSSLSAACYLAAEGNAVTVHEKNAQLGGRARQYIHDGFKFDMGPTWYWMPDVFERFFADFGKKASDFYQLEKLAPGYRVYFGDDDFIDVSDKIEELYETFENIEKGSAYYLKKFLDKARSNYDIAIKNLVYKPGRSPLELVTTDTLFNVNQFYLTVHQYISKHFKDCRLQQLLEFPVLFLGAKPSNTPLFYSFMNYADFGLGTWYPKGGMRSVVEGIVRLAEELGVTFVANSSIDSLDIQQNNGIANLSIAGDTIPSDIVVSGADYKHTESLLKKNYRVYSERYWDKKVMAPSSLLFYVGFSKKLENVLHHTLFFDSSFDEHASEIYDQPAWPKNPLFYASFPSVTDETVAPKGKEAAIFLIPLAPDLHDTEELRDKYFDMIIDRLERLTNQSVREYVVFKRSYCVNDFKEDYNSYKGNAYGMANTLLQTAFLRPSLKSKKVKNLYFTGQLTVPGPGVPPALISGKIVSDLIKKDTKSGRVKPEKKVA